jgi:hypothetical protein
LKRGSVHDLTRDLGAEGIKFLPIDATSIRVVFHLNNSEDACERLVAGIERWGSRL